MDEIGFVWFLFAFPTFAVALYLILLKDLEKGQKYIKTVGYFVLPVSMAVIIWGLIHVIDALSRGIDGIIRPPNAILTMSVIFLIVDIYFSLIKKVKRLDTVTHNIIKFEIRVFRAFSIIVILWLVVSYVIARLIS